MDVCSKMINPRMSSKQFSKTLRARARKPLLIRDLKFNQFLTKDNSFLTDWSKIIRKRSPLRYIDLKNKKKNPNISIKTIYKIGRNLN